MVLLYDLTITRSNSISLLFTIEIRGLNLKRMKTKMPSNIKLMSCSTNHNTMHAKGVSVENIFH